MLKLSAFFLFYLISSCYSSGSEVGDEGCKNVEIVDNFNADKYLGKWYEIKRYENFFEFGDCATAEYTLRNESIIDVKNTEKLKNGTYSSINGYAYLENPASSLARILVVFPVAPKPAPYWVLDTDYENYSVVYACEQIPNHKLEFLWVLSRKPELTEEQVQKIDKVFKKNGIGNKKFHVTNQNKDYCQ